MSPQLDIILIACVMAMATVIPGTFLVLRGLSLMSDAISHAILLGIVLMFFITHTLESPLLIIGAAISGVLTVLITELIISTRLVKEDAAIGLVFPVFFSIGVILINQYAGNVHLDTDAVLLGELAFAPFHRVVLFGNDFGPYALWVMGIILIINLSLLLIFYKELKLSTFDPALACSLGFPPILIHYGLMSMTSITAVGAFDAVGAILVVAMMICPPASAYLLCNRLSRMIPLAMILGVIASISGYGLAHLLNASIAGSMATMNGAIFFTVLFLAPQEGLLSKLLHHKRQKITFASHLLAVQLLSHEGTSTEDQENTIDNMVNHMNWSRKLARQVTHRGIQDGLMTRNGSHIHLTNLGREVAKSVMTE